MPPSKLTKRWAGEAAEEEAEKDIFKE